MDDAILERVEAIERAMTDGHAEEGLPEAGRMDERLTEVERTVENLDERLTELEAAVQALRGFAGGIDAVDEAVERRANAAVARVERLEAELRVDEDRTAAARRDAHGESRRGNHTEVVGQRGACSEPSEHTETTGDRVPRRDTESDSVAGEERTAVTGVETETTGRIDGLRSKTPAMGGSSSTSLAAAAAETAERERSSERGGPERGGPERGGPERGGPERADGDDGDSSLADRMRRLL
jgi:chromosome segregation ATPase